MKSIFLILFSFGVQAQSEDRVTSAYCDLSFTTTKKGKAVDILVLGCMPEGVNTAGFAESAKKVIKARKHKVTLKEGQPIEIKNSRMRVTFELERNEN